MVYQISKCVEHLAEDIWSFHSEVFEAWKGSSAFPEHWSGLFIVVMNTVDDYHSPLDPSEILWFFLPVSPFTFFMLSQYNIHPVLSSLQRHHRQLIFSQYNLTGELDIFCHICSL